MIPRHGDFSDDPDYGEQLVSDELWAAIQPLLAPKPPHPEGGRPRPGSLAVAAA